MSTIELITSEVCPYAQRTHLALIEKGLEFERREVDLGNKPQWFLALSPYGKVPALRIDGRTLWESDIINEYLDEVFPEPRLMPSDPYLRARARILIDYCNDLWVDNTYALLHEQDPVRQVELRSRGEDQLRYLEASFRELPSGIYWLGDAVSLVDLAFYPFFERLPAVAHYRGLDIPADCERLRAWCAAMSERESAKRTGHPLEYYLERYRRWAEAA